MGTRWPETCWATYKGEINIILKVTSSWSLYPHWEWLFWRELSGSGYLYLLRSVLWHLRFLELRVTSNTQVNFFQHQISCFVRRPPMWHRVGLLLVVLKSQPVLPFLFKWLNDAFSFLLTFTDSTILIIFACLRFVNLILYFRSFRETSNKYSFWYRRISSGPYQEYSKRYLTLQQARGLQLTIWWLLNQPKHFACVILPFMLCMTDFEKIYL